jgi:macrolide-specific efflux system membrane fusion protein
MSVARTWVFPILRIVVFAVIAVALVKVAFFADPEQQQQGGEFPTGAIVEPQIPVMTGTVRNDIVLDGLVSADATVPIKATLAGEVRQVSVAPGQKVAKGAELMQIRGFYDDGTHRWSIVKAPATGILSSFEILPGQHVGVGEVIGQVAPPSFSVTATLPPEQLYRLTEKPTEAEVAIVGGPAPFTCTRLKIITPLPGADSGEGGEGGSSGTTVRCSVPKDVQVFSGLTAQLTIAGGIAENVLTVPTTAVEGGSGTGIVYLVGPDGATEPREVTLGLSDGISVEVTGGLEEGDIILQFVPGAPGDPGMGEPGFIEGDYVEIEG